MKRIVAALLAAFVIAVAGCGDDSTEPKTDPQPSKYKNLTEEWHVLYNLAEAYNSTDINGYANIFDQENFTYFFFTGLGGVPEFWFYESEIQSARNMFTAQGGTTNNPILSIDVTIYDIESVQWVDLTSDDFPREVLRTAVVGYSFVVETENGTRYITRGTPQARFVVRNIDGRWKLVQWLDLGNG